MADAFKSFRQKADGPARLRATLRRDIKPLGVLLSSLDAPRAVRSEVARGVLGGDIFNVMSARLSGLLQHDAPPAATDDTARAKHATPQPSFNAKQDPTTLAPFVHPARAARPNNSHATSQALTTRRAPSDVKRVIDNVAANAQTSMTDDVTKLASLAAPAEAKARDREPSRFQSPSDETRGPARERRSPDSVLLIKLREYWQLNERAQSSVSPAPLPPQSPAAESPKNARPLPAAHFGEEARTRWPEVTGQQFARKLGAAASTSSGSFQRVEQRVNTDAPERVEIQNIFNVEVRAEGASGATSLPADLSESIADILREQAIQHGIDLT